MIHTGLVSITFRKLSPHAIVDLVKQAGLDGIEWGGDVHVPHGDVDQARTVGRLTREGGLTLPSYGSYYRVGVSEEQGLAFQAVLDAALALETDVIRVWAGNVGSDQADEAVWGKVVEDTQRIAQMAAAHNVTIGYEYHGNTLTDTYESAVRLYELVNCSNVKLYWQPRSKAMPVQQQVEQLRQLLPTLTHVHVFSWTFETGVTRHPLADGQAQWSEYLAVLQKDRAERYAMLEFVKDDQPEQFLEDAATLLQWLRFE